MPGAGSTQVLRQLLDSAEQWRGPRLQPLQVHGALTAVSEDRNVSPYIVVTPGTRVYYAVRGEGRGQFERIEEETARGGHGCEVDCQLRRAALEFEL